MRKILKEVSLTARDVKILTALFKNKVMSLKQIHTYFFGDVVRQISGRRMRALINAKLVNKYSIYLKNRSINYYSITPLGIKEIQEHLPCMVDSKEYVSDSLVHDLTLTELHFRFKNLNQVINTATESELLSCSEYLKNKELRPFCALRSDVALHIQSGKNSSYVALEYERTLKESSRNVQKFKDYYQYSKVPIVFYVCENMSLVRSLMKVDQKVCTSMESKMYFCSLENALAPTEEITFERSDGLKVKLS